MKSQGNGGKGISWKTDTEIELLGHLNGIVTEVGDSKGLPKMETDIQVAAVILTLAPETNGHVAVNAWKSLEATTGRNHTHLAASRADEKIRYGDLLAQPRKIITSPSGAVSILRRFPTMPVIPTYTN